MKIRDLFRSDVTRDIPPVVYFHEQSPEKLLSEVSEYIFTGGWNDDHPNQQRIGQGIHEQYVRLLTNIAAEIGSPAGADLPTAWISGFYGSGKSSFAKLLGLALDGVALPDGTSLSAAWLARNTAPRAGELEKAWKELREKIDPIAVVFDIGGVARDNEHIHAAAVRQVQKRLGYCSTEPLVADFELALERDGQWQRFEQTALQVLGRPWAEVKDRALAEEDFSRVMHVMYPERYTDPMMWYISRAGTHTRSESANDAVKAIGDMIEFRRKGATLFLVVDEVSQYVLAHKDRSDKLRAFASALGAGLGSRVWLLALGQQKLDEAAGDEFLVWAKDRFPPKFRVHLATTNIRDVVHKRLLQKRPEVQAELTALFEKYRADLKLYAFGGERVLTNDFVEAYPMLPEQMELILQLTSAMRTRSNRAQGDDQAIRGLLQLLGELFRGQNLADMPVGALVTLDQIYEVQHTALDSDVQASMARVLSQCNTAADAFLVRVAKAVALLELIQDTTPTHASLVAQCLYDRVDRGNNVPAVTEALEELRRRNLLSYSEKYGYKLQSSAGEEWERERRDIGAPRDALIELVQGGLRYLLSTPEKPKLHARAFPWAGRFSDGRRIDDASIADPRDDAPVCVDFRYLTQEERTESTWIKRSDEVALSNRLIWLCGDTEQIESLARELYRSTAMTRKYHARRDSLVPARRALLQQEELRSEDLLKQLREALQSGWMAGRMYFRGRRLTPIEQGASFATALLAAGNRILPDLFPHFINTQIQPAELMVLVETTELVGISPKFLEGELGIIKMDSGHYVPEGDGEVPRRVREFIETEGGVSGLTLLANFGGPPYGYTPNVTKACVAGLLRASRVRIQPDGGSEITAVRDAGVRDLFGKDRDFNRATIFLADDDDIGFNTRARICKFFETALSKRVQREDAAIADAVTTDFPPLVRELREVQACLDRQPEKKTDPPIFARLSAALEACLKQPRQTRPTVQAVKHHLNTLQEGVDTLRAYRSELSEVAITAVLDAYNVQRYELAQLQAVGADYSNVETAATLLAEHLSSDRPWLGINGLADDIEAIRSCYESVRRSILEWQEKEAESVRLGVKRRDGFSTLTADQAHRVLRPLTAAVTATTAEATAPTLTELKDPFLLTLRRAETEANELLDEVLSQGAQPQVKPVDLKLRHRELKTAADVEALVDEIRTRLLQQIEAGARVRLL